MPPSAAKKPAAAPRARPRPRGRRRAAAGAAAPRGAGATVRDVARARASGAYQDAILAAAEAEFTERGFAATRMVDVARRAGMSVGALYRHFDSKEAIFAAMMMRAAEAFLARLDAADRARPRGDLRGRLHGLVATTLGFIEENRATFLLFNQLGGAACAAFADDHRSLHERVHGRYRAVLAAGAVRRDVAIDDQLRFVSGAMHGFIEGWLLDGATWRLAGKVDVITELVLCALGGPS